jgi:hypothetical protein
LLEPLAPIGVVAGDGVVLIPPKYLVALLSEVRSGEGFYANSPRCVGPARAGRLGFGAQVEATGADNA